MRRSSILKCKNSVFLFQFVSDSNPLVILVICAADRRTSSAYEHGEQGDIQIGAWGDFPSRVFDAKLDAGADLDELDEGEEMMGSKYDDVDEDRRPIKFNKDKPTIDVGTIFESVEDCRYAVATYAIQHGFEYYTEKSDKRRLRVHCRHNCANGDCMHPQRGVDIHFR